MTHLYHPRSAEESPFSPDQILALIANLNPNRISSRSQSGQKLSYVEAHDIKNVMIGVFGFANFSSDVIESKILRQERVQNSKKTGENWEISAQATVRITIHATGATYTETAIAGSKQPDWTEAADMAIKSAESDAFKRAAIFLGTQFGLSLYAGGTTQNQVKGPLDPAQRELIQLGKAEREARRAAAIEGNSAAAQPKPEEQPSGEFVGYAEPQNVPHEDDAPAGPESAPAQQDAQYGQRPELAAQPPAEQVRSAPPIEDAMGAVQGAFAHGPRP